MSLKHKMYNYHLGQKYFTKESEHSCLRKKVQCTVINHCIEISKIQQEGTRSCMVEKAHLVLKSKMMSVFPKKVLKDQVKQYKSS